MSIPKFVGTIVTKVKVWLDSTRHKLVHREIVVAMVTSCKQIRIVPNDNPIWLDIANEIVSVQLRRSGHASKLWFARFTADSHDLKMREGRRIHWIYHNINITPFSPEVKLSEQKNKKRFGTQPVRVFRKSLSINELPGAASSRFASLW